MMQTQPRIESEIQNQKRQTNYEGQNFQYPHQINSYENLLYLQKENTEELLPPYQEQIINDTLQHQFEPPNYYDTQLFQNQGQIIYENQHLQNNEILEVPLEYQNNAIYETHNQYQDFQSQYQISFQPNRHYQIINQDNLLHSQNQPYYQIQDF